MKKLLTILLLLASMSSIMAQGGAGIVYLDTLPSPSANTARLGLKNGKLYAKSPNGTISIPTQAEVDAKTTITGLNANKVPVWNGLKLVDSDISISESYMLDITGLGKIGRLFIGADPDTPDPSAILDITSDNRGILIPRMTTVERNNIANPAEGLLVYDTDFGAVFFYKSGWVNSNDRSSHTGTQAIATVSGLQAELDAKAPLTGGSGYVQNQDAADQTANYRITGVARSSEVDVNGTAPLITLNNTTTPSTPDYTIENDGYLKIRDKLSDDIMLTVKGNEQVMIGTDDNSLGNSSRLFVYGGNSGANIDVMGEDVLGKDQAVVELESADFATSYQSSAFRHFGPKSLGTTLGINNNTGLGVIDLSKVTGIIKTTYDDDLIFGTDDAERMRIDGSTGNITTSGTINGRDIATDGTKLDGLSAGAEQNVNPDWNASSGDAQILNKPTTVAGYGISDAYTDAEVDGLLADKAPLNSPTFTGTVTLPSTTSIGNVSSTELSYVDGLTSSAQSQLSALQSHGWTNDAYGGIYTMKGVRVGTSGLYSSGAAFAVKTSGDEASPVLLRGVGITGNNFNGLDLGVYNDSTTAYLQHGRWDNLGAGLDLALNPKGGNVAIGQWADEGYKLNVAGSFKASGDSYFGGNVGVGSGSGTHFQAYDGITSNFPFPNQISALNSSNGVEVGMFAHATKGYIGTWTNNDLFIRRNNLDRISVTSTGVGIGNTNPTSALDVEGVIDGWGFRTDSSNTNYNFISRKGSLSPALYVQNSDPNGDLLSLINGSVKAGIGTSKFIVKGSGNVGVGVSNPIGKLEVSGGVPAGFISTFTNTDTGISSNGLKVEISNNHTNNTVQRWLVSGSEVARVGANGNVGVGTTTPSSQLHIYGANQSTNSGFNTTGAKGGTLYLQDQNSVAYSGGTVLFGANSGSFAAIKANLRDGSGNTKGDLDFQTRNAAGDAALTSRLFIQSDGKVGVGTVLPASNMHISGIGAPEIRVQDSDGTNQYTSIGHNAGTTSYTSRNNTSNGVHDWYGYDGTTFSKFMTLSSIGNLGIGTASPNAKVDIEVAAGSGIPALGANGGHLNLSNGLYGTLLGTKTNGDGWIQQQRTDATATAYNLLLQPNGGNVGIGTTTPDALLSLDRDGGAAQLKISRPTFSSGAGIGSMGFANNVGNYVASITGYYGNVNTDGSLVFRAGTSNANAYLVPEVMRITGGKLGIGTADPQKRLHVVSTSNNYAAHFEGVGIAGSNYGILIDAGSNTSDYSFRIRNSSAADKFVIRGDGNVGIGTVSPADKLSVVGDHLATFGAYRNHNASSSPAASVIEIGALDGTTLTSSATIGSVANFTGANNTGDLRFSTADNGVMTEQAIITSTGNIGIGTSSPTAKTHIVTSSSNGSVSSWNDGQFVVGQAGNAGGIALTYSTSDNSGSLAALSPNVAWRNIGYRANDHIFYTAGATERLRIVAATGNVGVGTTTPRDKLDIIDGSGISLRYSEAANTAGAFRIMGRSYSGARMTGVMLSAGTDYNTLSYGGGTTYGEPATQHVWYANSTVGSLAVGTQVMKLTSDGLILTKLTTTQINAIVSPTSGLTVYNTTLNTICFFNGTSWQKVTSSAM